eukprot:GHVN01021809.1.p1 GENE.GHVN01021809.1~~GHVN01021809.1.p1  ORF type:complete len:117 (+),score=17.60 GHVN01021809.1:37-387(+)
MGLASCTRAVLANEMDFRGQDLAYNIMVFVLGFAGIIGFIVGFALQQFFITFKFIAVGTIIAGVLCVPSWPIYTRHPVKWQAPRHSKTDSSPSNSPGTPEKEKEAKSSPSKKSKTK